MTNNVFEGLELDDEDFLELSGRLGVLLSCCGTG